MKSLIKANTQLAGFRRALARVDVPEDAIKIGAGIAGIEEMMRKSGLYRTDAIRPVRELFLDSRWTLGKLTRKMDKSPPGKRRGSGVTSLPQKKRELIKLGLSPPTIVASERISTLPENEKTKTYKNAERQDILPTIEMLIDVARPYWYKASREDKHKDIARGARAAHVDKVGPYPLIYADPPWKFATYSEKGLEKTPDQHYPTLTDDQIANFKVNGLFVRELAMKSAALLLWCTSSNIHRALEIMQAWDFQYKSQAVWVKTKANGKIWTGTGLVFRNAHEVLLYGTRGSMPGPQYQPPSVMMYPRGRHSEKPAGVRREIERMYPDFSEDERAELFARDQYKGWTCYGFEALSKAA